MGRIFRSNRGVRVYLQRHIVGQTPLGVFTNLWPTSLSRRDRAVCGRYFTVHVGTWRLEIYGKAVH